MHHDGGADVAGCLHGAKDLTIVAVEHARVGHEQLEAGDTLVLGEIAHCLQRFVIDAANDLMKRIVDRALTSGFFVPRAKAVDHVLAITLHSEVDNGGDAAPCRCTRARLEGVAGVGATERQLHVRVHIDAAWDDVLASGVDDRLGSDSLRLHLPWRIHRNDGFAVDKNVDELATGWADNRAVGDECACHELLQCGQRAVSSEYASGRRSR